MATMHRARAVLKMKKKITVSVTGKANAMCTGLANNAALFTTPNPSISTIQNQVVVVNKAEVLAATRGKGLAAARNVQLGILVGMLETELTYIQGVADTSATPDQAVATILAGGVLVAIVAPHIKPVLAATQGAPGSLVTLTANATALGASKSRKTFFNWQSTADGGKTFVTLPPTPKATTTVANLTPLSTYGFRVSVTNSAGIQGEWSQIISFLVH
jgi:hypothetical protein